MALRNFNEWKKLNEGRKDRGRKETDCPRPKDPEFCRKWNLYLNGQGPDPLEQEEKKVSTGHNPGPRAATYRDKKDIRNARKGRNQNPFTRDY